MTQPEIMERKFGFVVLKKGLATKEQITQAIQEKKRHAAKGKTIHIGDAFVLLKILTPEQRDEILETLKRLQEKSANLKKTSQAEESLEKDQTPAKEQPSEEEPPDLEGAKKVQNDSGFELAVTSDRFQAYIYPLEDNVPAANLESIKDLMEGIQNGVAEDSKITEYLDSTPTKKDLFKIAQGQPTDPGKPTEIQYHFDTDPIKPATIDESGRIDYKNRGVIPMVNDGDLLAEVVPGTGGKPGQDIYGRTVDPPLPDVIALVCGNGVKKNEDGLKVFSVMYGRPELLKDGTICVSDTLSISGDVGVETGNIEFDGHIEVKGAVQEGYKVVGKTLKANEIHNAKLEMQGDVVVSKGIIGATIRTDGNVKARHMRDSKIDALGDITVEREVYECHVESNGFFRIERGTIMGSSISAMKGLEASEIGSEASDPCTIITGIDNRLEKQITTLNLKISKKEKEQEKLKSLLKNLLRRPEILEEEIGELAQKQDEAMRKGRALEETLKSLKEKKDKKNMIKVLTIIKGMNAKLKKIQLAIDKRVEEQDTIEEKISNHNDNIKRIIDEIEEFQDDIKSLVEMSTIRQVSTGVKATGTIYDRTSIRGRNASLLVKGNLRRVHAFEIKNPDESPDQAWLMSVSSL